MLILGLLPVALATAPSGELLHQAWLDSAEARSLAHTQAPSLELDSFERLARGEALVDVPRGENQALGMVFVPAPPAQVWVALDDIDHSSASDGGHTMRRLPQSTAQRRLAYGYVDSPMPIQDRQWVSETHTNSDLWAHSGGSCWERWNTLGDPKEAPQSNPEALWLTWYTSSWLLVEAPGGTLAVFRIGLDPSGGLSSSVMGAWAQFNLDDALERVVQDAGLQMKHYDAEHPPAFTPDGVEIPRFEG